MFSLLYGFWRYLFQKDEYYVLILGLDNAGKTTFLEQTKISMNPGYKGLNLMKISCTVGLNIGKIDSDGVVLNFWDLGGQSELQCLWDKVYIGIVENHYLILDFFSLLSSIMLNHMQSSMWSIHPIMNGWMNRNKLLVSLLIH